MRPIGGYFNPPDPAYFAEPTEPVLMRDLYASTGWDLGLSARSTALDADNNGGAYSFSTSIPNSVSGDRITLSPAATGDYALTVGATPDGGVAADETATVHVIDPAASATTFEALLVGDSLTAHQTYPSQVATRISGKGTIVGTQGTAGAKHEGHSGWSWETFISSGSPFYNGGVDIPSYITTLGTTPDIVVWLLGTNRIFSASDVEYEAVETEEVGYAADLIESWPLGAIHVIVLPLPGNAGGSWTTPSRETYRTRNDSLHRRLLARFDNLEYNGVYILHGNTSVDPDTAYSDLVHPTNDYASLGDTVASFLLWAAQNVL